MLDNETAIWVNACREKLRKIVEPGKLKQIEDRYIKAALEERKVENARTRDSLNLGRKAATLLIIAVPSAFLIVALERAAKNLGFGTWGVAAVVLIGVASLAFRWCRAAWERSPKTQLRDMWAAKAYEAFTTQDLGNVDLVMCRSIMSVLLEEDEVAIETAETLINDRNFQGNIVELCETAKRL